MLAWPRTLWQNAKKRCKERLSVSVSSGCGLDFHKRCAFLLPNDCSRIRRQVSTSFSLFPPRRPRTHSLSSQAGGSLEEVTSVPASSLLCCFSFFPAPICVSAHLNRFQLLPPVDQPVQAVVQAAIVERAARLARGQEPASGPPHLPHPQLHQTHSVPVLPPAAQRALQAGAAVLRYRYRVRRRTALWTAKKQFNH